MSSRSSTSLSAFQEGVEGIDVDLSVGYPRFVDRRNAKNRLIALLTADSSEWDYSDDMNRLTTAFRRLVPTSADRILATRSGSDAISRTLEAIAYGRRIAITSPGFDAVFRFATEAGGQKPLVIPQDPFGRADDNFARLIESISADIGVLFLVSPDNPSGRVLDRQQMVELSVRCGQFGVTLVVDQCFALVNPFSTEVPLISEFAKECSWCLLWDSGKTMDLYGEKIGLIAASDELLEPIRESLSALHLHPPPVAVHAVGACLDELCRTDEIELHNQQIAENYRQLAKCCGDLGITVNSPAAGSFVLIGLGGTKYERSSLGLTDRLLEERIAVAPSPHLLAEGTTVTGGEFVRVCLARDGQDITLLCEALERLFRH